MCTEININCTLRQLESSYYYLEYKTTNPEPRAVVLKSLCSAAARSGMTNTACYVWSRSWRRDHTLNRREITVFKAQWVQDTPCLIILSLVSFQNQLHAIVCTPGRYRFLKLTPQGFITAAGYLKRVVGNAGLGLAIQSPVINVPFWARWTLKHVQFFHHTMH